MTKDKTILVSHSVRGKSSAKDRGILPPPSVKTSPEDIWIANYYPDSRGLSTGSTRGQRFRSKLAKRFQKSSPNSAYGDTNSSQKLHKGVGFGFHASGFKRILQSENTACKPSDCATVTTAATNTSDQLFITLQMKSPPEAENVSITTTANNIGAVCNDGTTSKHCCGLGLASTGGSSSAAEVDNVPVLFNSITADVSAGTSDGASTNAADPKGRKGRFRHNKRSRRARSIDNLVLNTCERPLKRHHFRRWLNAKNPAAATHVDGPSQTAYAAAVEAARMANVRNNARVAIRDGAIASAAYAHAVSTFNLERNQPVFHDEVAGVISQADIAALPEQSQNTVEACPPEVGKDANKVDDLSLRAESTCESISSENSADKEACPHKSPSNDDVDSGLTLAAHSKIPRLMSQLESLVPKSALLESLILNNELVGSRATAVRSQREPTLPASESQSEEKSEDDGATINLLPFAKSPISTSLFAESFNNEQGHLGTSPQVTDLVPMTGTNSDCEMDTGNTDNTEMPTTKSTTALPNIWGFFARATKADDDIEADSGSTNISPMTPKSSFWKSFGKQLGVTREEDHRIISTPENIVSPFGDDKIGYAF